MPTEKVWRRQLGTTVAICDALAPFALKGAGARAETITTIEQYSIRPGASGMSDCRKWRRTAVARLCDESHSGRRRTSRCEPPGRGATRHLLGELAELLTQATQLTTITHEEAGLQTTTTTPSSKQYIRAPKNVDRLGAQFSPCRCGCKRRLPRFIGETTPSQGRPATRTNGPRVFASRLPTLCYTECGPDSSSWDGRECACAARPHIFPTGARKAKIAE